MGSLPKMIFIVNNAKFAQHAVMVPGQLSYFSLAHGSRADFDSVDATRFNTASSDELELPLGQGPRQNSATSMGFKLETSATEVVKQQLVLVVKTTTSQHWFSLGTATVHSRRPHLKFDGGTPDIGQQNGIIAQDDYYRQQRRIRPTRDYGARTTLIFLVGPWVSSRFRLNRCNPV